MAEERNVVVRFVGKDDVSGTATKVTKSIDKVGQSAGTSAKGVGSLITSMSGLANAVGMTGGTVGTAAMSIGALAGPVGLAVGGAVALVAALGTVAYQSALTANNVENLRKGIITLADSESEGRKLYSTLIDIASRTPFERQDVIEMGRSLLGAGIEAERIPDYVYAIGDAVTTIGGTAQNIDSVTTAIGRMQLGGKLSYEQMVQIQENGIPVFQLLADATGRSTEEIIKLAQDGLLPAKGNLDILIGAMQGQYGDAMASQMGTASQSASNLADAWQDASTSLGNYVQPLVTGTINLLTDLVNWTNQAGQDFIRWGRGVDAQIAEMWSSAMSWTSKAWADAGTWISEATKVTGQYISESMTVKNITALVNGLGEAWANTVGIVGNAFGQVEQFSKDTVSAIDNAVQGTWAESLWQSVKTSADNTATAIGDAMTSAGEASKQAWNDAGTYINNIMTTIHQNAQAAGSAAAVASLYADTQNRLYVGQGVWLNVAERTVDQLFKTIPPMKELIVTEKELTKSTRDSNDALRAQERALAETQRKTSEYKQAIGNLRDSFMNIADAERSVADAQKALRDAMDPLRVQQMTLSLQAQQMSMRDLNASMDDMRARREAIARAIKSMNDAQIRQNALSAQERQQLKDTNTELRQMEARREQIRKALASGRLNETQRVEFLQTEAALTAAIADQSKIKNDLTQKQDDAIKRAQEERLRLLEEDKRLQADLEKSQLRAKQAIVDLHIAQRQLSEAQNPARLDAYRDAITKAQNNLIRLRLEQEDNRKKADELAKSLGITSESLDTLRLSAADTASPLDDVSIKSEEVAESVGGVNGSNAAVTTLSGNMRDLGNDTSTAVQGLTNVQASLKKIQDMKLADSLGKTLSSIGDGIASIAESNVKFATDNLTAPLMAIRDLTRTLDAGRAIAMRDWANAYTVAVNGSSNTSNVKNLINALVSLKNATIGSSDPLPYYLTGGKPKSIGNGSSLAFSGAGVGAGAGVQNITINLNYASPPSSSTPLKDVEDYLAAQGGRLRI